MKYAELRRAVYTANMALKEEGLVVLTWGNASQIDRDAGVFGIKPSGISYARLRPEDIVVVSLADGEIVDGDLNPSSDTPTHLELYRAFREVGGVVHTHSVYATAWAQACLPLECFGTTHADHFHGPVPLARELGKDELDAYEANTGRVIVETFGGSDPSHTPGVLVQHHGPFAWGKDAADAVRNAVVLEEVAKMNAITLGIDPAAPALPRHILDKHFSRKHGPNAYYGQRES